MQCKIAHDNVHVCMLNHYKFLSVLRSSLFVYFFVLYFYMLLPTKEIWKSWCDRKYIIVVVIIVHSNLPNPDSL